DLLGRKIDDLMVPSANLSRVVAETTAQGRAAVEVARRNKNGKGSRFDVSFSRWIADGRIFITTIWRDVTDLLAAQDVLRESDEVLEARVAQRTREREVALGQLYEAQKMDSIGQLT